MHNTQISQQHTLLRILLKFLSFSSFALGIFLFSGCDKSQEFSVIKPIQEEMIELVEVDGKVQAKTEVNLSFQTSGKIENIYFKENQTVKKGDIIANLDAGKEYISIQRNQASLSAIKAQLALKYASPAQESIALSNELVKEAELSVKHSQLQLLDIQEINKQKIKTSSQEVSRLQIQQNNAQIAYNAIQNIGEIDEQKEDKTLEDILEISEKQIKTTLDAFVQNMSLSRSILAPVDEHGKDRFLYIGGISASKNATIMDYQILSSRLTELELEINLLLETKNKESIENIFSLLIEYGEKNKTLMNNEYELMNKSVSNVRLLETEIESLKKSITAEQKNLTSQIGEIRNLYQKITNTDISKNKTQAHTLLEINNAKAELENITSALALAKINLETVKKQGKIDKKSLEREIERKKLIAEKAKINHKKLLAKPRNVDVAQLRANIEQQKALLNQSQKDISDTKIIAPFNGVITKITTEVGENIVASKTAIVFMSEDLQITATIPEIDIAKIKIGDQAKIKLDAFENKKFIGKVENINRAETEIQGATYYEATISIEKNSEIKSGMSGDVEITRNKKHTALLIPQSAIEYEAGKYFVYISDNQKNAEPIKTLVKIGMRKDENVEILSGISTDDNIVIFTK